MRPVISLEGISKSFNVYKKPMDLAKELVTGRVYHDTFWALRDINLDVFEKDRIGIVGANGAGKSTLLQIIAGTMRPTSGSLRVDGKISPLLSLTPSWNSEESGLENIRFNLFIQGADPKRIPQMIEDIIEFTELGPFIYQPVRTYSSGMSARLAFAIATAIDPEILIVDEVLGAGDAYFVSKAYRRMVDFCNRGRALLFVSHAPGAILRLCERAIWLQNGVIRNVGKASEIVKEYETQMRYAEDESVRNQRSNEREDWRRFGTGAEFPEFGSGRLRISPAHGGHFTETHYINEICVSQLANESTPLSLEITDPDDARTLGSLDIFGSEWGRLHERQGCLARVVSRNYGRSPGAQFILKRPRFRDGESICPVTVALRYASTVGTEKLIVEYLDVNSGEWRPYRMADESVDGEWRQVVFDGEIEFPAEQALASAREAASEKNKPVVEFLDAFIESGGTHTSLVDEGDPFSINVKLRFNEQVLLADVAVRFIRSDGIYCYWMSSGMNGGNLKDATGDRIVRFHFDENVFGAGDYHITVHVNNGWQYPDNYPYSHVYCREIDILKLRVKAKLSALDMGIVNQKARITVDEVVG